MTKFGRLAGVLDHSLTESDKCIIGLEEIREKSQIVAEPSAQKEIRNIVYTAMDALRGILISAVVDQDPDRTRRRWDRACAHLRQIPVSAASPEASD